MQIMKREEERLKIIVQKAKFNGRNIAEKEWKSRSKSFFKAPSDTASNCSRKASWQRKPSFVERHTERLLRIKSASTRRHNSRIHK